MCENGCVMQLKGCMVSLKLGYMFVYICICYLYGMMDLVSKFVYDVIFLQPLQVCTSCSS